MGSTNFFSEKALTKLQAPLIVEETHNYKKSILRLYTNRP
jgi:hypothetical protein